MTGRCPSDLALEAYLLDPGRSALAPHVAACEPCRTRLARMEAEAEEFRRLVYPATVGEVEDAAEPRRRRLLSVIAPVAGFAAAAAAAVLLVRPAGPPPDYVGAKGAPMALAVFVGGEGGAVAVPDGAAVPADAAIRFKVRPAPGCRLWIISVDAAGQVSRLFPAAGDAAEVADAGPLPGGAVLDGTAGPERIFAVCAPAALPYDSVERAARAAAGGGPEKVRAAKALPGLPARASQATLLLEKRT